MTAEEALRAMSFLQQNAFVPITAKLMHNLNNGLLDLTVAENKDKPHIEFVKGGETVITVRKGYVLKSSDAEALQDHEEKIFAKFGGTIVFNLTTGVAQSGWYVTEVLRQTA